MKKKVDKKEIIKKGNETLKEFKTFISKGNIIDMAVGVIIGTAFSKIVTSVVNDILTPLLGIVIGGLDFTNLTLKVGDATISYGIFLQNVFDFLVVAACIFTFIKILSKFNKKEEVKEEVKKAPKKDEQIILLEEIRDLLKNNKTEK